MMWVLLVLGGFALLLGIERTLYLHRGQIKAKAFIDGIKNILAICPIKAFNYGILLWFSFLNFNPFDIVFNQPILKLI